MIDEKEEKQRHQRQYPGYRYQPRRAGKPNGLRPISSSSADDLVRCPKCNGRYISTPSTPLTPFTPAFGPGPRNERLIPFTSSRNSVTEVPMYSSQMQNTRLDTPRLPPNPQTHRRVQYPPPPPLQTHHERDEDMDLLSPSPGQKRRRFNEENQRGYAANSPISYSTPQAFTRTGAPTMSAGYQPPLPGPGMMARPGIMGPPPQQSPMNQQSRHQYTTRSNTFDESLRLPPLQTQLPSSTPTTSRRPDVRMEAREIQARSIEAMVMTIPYVNKIKVLTKISPPLAPPGPTSPAQEIRGAVLAIEGPDKETLAEVGAFINEHLTKDPSYKIRTWETTTLKSVPPQTTDTEMANATIPTPMAVDNEEKDPFVDYLAIISEWHKKSLEMTKYITTSPDSASTDTNRAVAPSTKGKVLPIALVPSGFSLSTSDTFALRIPINDSYAPVDHWQWMATLWRGIVGPDLTIFVNKVGRDEMNKMGGVEIRGDCTAIIVRVVEGCKMDEKTARRLGFEVVEFVRNVESGFGRN
jgi:HMG box factor, other